MKNYSICFLLILFVTAISFQSCRRHPFQRMKKPVIYIYPEQNMQVNVQLKLPKDRLIHSYPKYPVDEGWTVLASPEGNLKDPRTNRNYYALFWESEGSEIVPTNGFIVKGEESAQFLEEKLAILGLSEREANEFIMYWLPQMENNPYNHIHFATQAYTDKAILEISPKPETLIRVFMVFEGLKAPKEVRPQKLIPQKRKGFTVVEWGGAEYKSSWGL